MKNCKNKITRLTRWVWLLSIMAWFGCESLLEKVNTNPYQLTQDQLVPDDKTKGALELGQMFNRIHNVDPTWQHQLQYNLMGDVFSQHQIPPTPFAANQNNSTLKLVAGWNGFLFTIGQTYFVAPWLLVQKKNQESPENQIVGLSHILKVIYMHKLVDAYGAMPYRKLGQSGEYDDGLTIYKEFFKELDKANELLEPFVKKGGSLKGKSEYNAVKESDLIHGGDLVKWYKTGNSIRLRLAMRLAKVDPQLSKKEFEKGVAAGVITTNADNAIQNPGSQTNPYLIYSEVWGDIRMTGTMESYLRGWKDDRIKQYFLPVDTIFKIEKKKDSWERVGEPLYLADGTLNDYKGIRVGSERADKSIYLQYSKLGPYPNSTLPVILASEVHFLMAEAKLRGYNVQGTAQDHYEQGIQLSFEKAGATLGSYLSGSTPPADYEDILSSDNNAPAPTSIAVKWDDAASNEEKLERIIAQKWIALFPDGHEAWSEYRRTGYPKLFSYKLNYSGNKIDSDLGPRRIPFSTSEYNTNGANVKVYVDKNYGGSDDGGKKIFWDRAVSKTGSTISYDNF